MIKSLSLVSLAALTACGLSTSHAALNLVYSQHFQNAAAGTTGSGLNDGSFMVGNENHTVQVYESPGEFKALWLTSLNNIVSGSFYLPDLNPGEAVTDFRVNFKVLMNNPDPDDVPFADGFSFNFGEINNTSSTYGSELGIHGDNTGDVLTVGWKTFETSGRYIAAFYNGEEIGRSNGITGLNTEDSPDGSDFVPVSIEWNLEDGLSLSYNNSVIFSDLATGAFSPEAGYQFAFAGRTWGSYQNTFIDDPQVFTIAVPEPSAFAAIVGLLALGFAGLRRRVL